MVSLLEILLILLAVIAVLAVGPMFVWRLLLGTEDTDQPHRRGSSFVPILLTLAGVVSVVLMVLLVRTSSRQVHNQPAEIAAVDVTAPVSAATDAGTTAERSLLESTVSRTEMDRSETPHGRPVPAVSVWGVLLPLLAIMGVIALASTSRRNGLFRLFPVVLAVVLIGIVVLNTRWAHQLEREHRMRRDAAARVEIEAARRQGHHRRVLRPRLPATRLVVGPAEDQVAVSETDSHPLGAGRTAAIDTATTDTKDGPSPVTEYVGTELFGVPRDSLPEWARSGAHAGTTRLLRSGKHATVEEAERDLLGQMRDVLQAELVRKHPAARGWVPPDKVVINSGSLQRRAIERSQIQVGEHQHPMYEVYWEIDAAVEAPLYQSWRPNVVKTRLVWLGAGVGLLTLLFGSLAAILHIDEQTGGRRRKVLATGTVAMWVAIGTAVLAATVS